MPIRALAPEIPVSVLLRRGARCREEIEPQVLRWLNAGQIPTVNRIERQAVDQGQLLDQVLDELGLKAEKARFAAALDGSRNPWRRNRAISRVWVGLMAEYADHLPVWEYLSSHPADGVRVWAALSLGQKPDLVLAERLTAIRRFAADPHPGVREAAALALLPHLRAEESQAVFPGTAAYATLKLLHHLLGGTEYGTESTDAG